MTEDAVMWARVKDPVSPGQTSIKLDRNGGLLGTSPIPYMLVGVGNDQWEWKPVQNLNVNGDTISGLRPFAHSYVPGEVVGICSLKQKIPMSWLGGVHDNISSAAIRNRTVINRFLDFWGQRDSTHTNSRDDPSVLALDGAYYIDAGVSISSSATRLTGMGNFRKDGLIAHSSFVFLSNHSTFMLTHLDEHGGPGDAASYWGDIFLDGQGMSDSYGCTMTPQQPGVYEKILLRGFRYIGMIMGGQNCWDVNHIYGEDNTITCYFWQTPYTVRDIHVRNPHPNNGVSNSIIITGRSARIMGGSVRGFDDAGSAILLAGTSNTIYNFNVDGLRTVPGNIVQNVGEMETDVGAIYRLVNIRYNRDIHPNAKILQDIPRNLSIKDADIYGNTLDARGVSPDSTLYDGETKVAHGQWRTGSQGEVLRDPVTGWPLPAVGTGVPHDA